VLESFLIAALLMHGLHFALLRKNLRNTMHNLLRTEALTVPQSARYMLRESVTLFNCLRRTKISYYWCQDRGCIQVTLENHATWMG